MLGRTKRLSRNVIWCSPGASASSYHRGFRHLSHLDFQPAPCDEQAVGNTCTQAWNQSYLRYKYPQMDRLAVGSKSNHLYSSGAASAAALRAVMTSVIGRAAPRMSGLDEIWRKFTQLTNCSLLKSTSCSSGTCEMERWTLEVLEDSG